MPQRLDILARLHARLLEIVGTGLPLIASSMKDADLVGLAHLRDEMVAAIDAYAHHVHQLLDAATRSGDPARIALAQDIKVGAIRLEEAYRSFRLRWAHRDARLNWPEYRLSAIMMMKQIRDQVRTASGWTADHAPIASHRA